MRKSAKSTGGSRKVRTARKRTKPSPVAWFEIVGKRGDELRRFYTQLFEWGSNDVAPGAEYGVMDAAPEGIGGGVGSSRGKSGHVTIFVEVDDFEATLQAAESLGAKRVGDPLRFTDKRPSARSRGSVEFVYFTDPSGNLVGLCRGIVRR